MRRGIIAAVSPEGVIGLEGRTPWHYRADMKRFKRLTEDATIIMGRLTWESLPKRPLPGRRNIVITSRKLPDVEHFPSLEEALDTCEGDVWFIGGARIYEEAMRYADFIDLTYVPDQIDAEGAVYFPEIDESIWEPGPLVPDEDDPRLKRRIFRRRKAVSTEKRHEYVSNPDLPAPLGPYSPAVKLGNLVFVSGQGAADPKTGELVSHDVEEQTAQVFRNLEAILKASGSSLKHVLRCTVFLADIGEFPRMNAVYEKMFEGHRPARTTVQAGALPMTGLKVEIDAIAYAP